ncbi:protein UL31 [Aotine betaherpesvirus 1]|uniref:Protein UL31 n=1 Tax=Aotine betaherpesvirus 1 TaxID=50290 RepID=G8XUA6_9BETA|nr:protein UL31 [Aotine betaherpesvirus 1]AEV80737.1 protein UL31 [Aotine betaherpesvirus 1]
MEPSLPELFDETLYGDEFLFALGVDMDETQIVPQTPSAVDTSVTAHVTDNAVDLVRLGEIAESSGGTTDNTETANVTSSSSHAAEPRETVATEIASAESTATEATDPNAAESAEPLQEVPVVDVPKTPEPPSQKAPTEKKTSDGKATVKRRYVPERRQVSTVPNSTEHEYVLPDASIVHAWIDELRTADRDNIGRCVRHTYVHHTSYYLSAYESYLFGVIEEYNNDSSVLHKATFLHGCIFFSCSTVTIQSEHPNSWTNLMVPKSFIRELFFLLCSTNGSSIVCQPLITKGGLCSSLLIHTEPLPPEQRYGLAQTQLVLIPMVPYHWSKHAVSFIVVPDDDKHRDGALASTSPASPAATAAATEVTTTWHPPVDDEIISPFGQATVIRHNNSVLFTLKQLSWTSKRVLAGRRKRVVHYISQFKGPWYHEFDPTRDAWVASKNIEYEFMGLPFTVNVDTLCIDVKSHTLIGTVSTSHCHRILDKLTARNMPRSISFYITLMRRRYVDLQFNRNPSIFFSGDVLNIPFLSEPDPFTAIVHAPYDINFTTQTKHTVRLDITYTQTAERCFLVANVPHNNSFYTGLRLWKTGELKITLWSPSKTLLIPQGAPIAVLYQINDTTGDLIAHNEKTVFKHQFENEQISFYLGSLKLPEINFLASYYY